MARFAGCERAATTQLVAHLAELDARRLYLGAGFSSLFGYCCEVLHLSEHETYNRIEAARAARRFPIILDRLSEGAVNLTTIRLLAPYLTDDNHRDLLGAAANHNKRAVEELIARRFPRPDIVSSLRKLPAPRLVANAATGPVKDGGWLAAPPGHNDACPVSMSSKDSPTAPPEPAAQPPPARRPLVAALAPDRYEIRFTMTAGTRDKLRLAQDLLRHAIPTGDPAEIVDRALTLLLEDLARKKVAAARMPALSPRKTARGSRHIPAKVRRAIWLRDGGRCAFVAKGGRRCTERSCLEFHHVKPYGVGGEAETGNIELRCRSHNAYEADVFYGRLSSRDGSGIAWEAKALDAHAKLDSFRTPNELTIAGSK